MHGTVRGLFRLIGALAMLALVLAAWAAHRLSEGPLSLSGLTPYIEQALSRPENGFSVKVGNTILTWNKPSHSLEIEAIDVHMLAEDGHPLAALPEMSVALSGAALLRGKLVPRAIRLYHPVLHLVRDETGAVSLGIGGSDTDSGAPDAQGSDVAEAGFNALIEPPGKETLAGQLQRIEVIGGVVTVEDRQHGISWKAPNSDLSFRRGRGRGIALHARLDLDLEGQPGHLDADGVYLLGARALDLTLQAGGIKPATVAKLTPQLDFLAGMQLPVGGSVSLRYAFGTGFTALKTDLAAGEGILDLTSIAGFSLPVKSVRVRADYQNGNVTLDELRADLGGPILTATGTLDGIGGEMKLGLEAQIDGVALDELAGIWPSVLAPHPRAWVTSNLSHGNIQTVTASLQGHVPTGHSLGELKVDRLVGGMGLDDVTVRYMPEMPVVEHVSGSATFDQDVFTIALGGGTAGNLSVPEGRVVLAGLSQASGQTADISVKIDGSLGDILRFIDHPPLGYTTKLGLDPAVVTGEGRVDLSLRFPLVDNLSLDQLKIKVEADTKGLFIPKQLLDLDLVDGDLHLSVDNEGLDANGSVQIDGKPGSLTWRENFAANAPFRSRYQVSGQLSDDGRKRVGLGSAPFQPPYLTGVLPISVVAIAQAGGRFDISAKADLTPAKLTLPGLNFSKPAGVAAEATAELQLTDNKLSRVQQFHVGGKGLDVSGDVSFDKGEIKRVTLSAASFARTRMSGSIAFQPDGGLSIKADGPSFDAREIVHGRLSDPVTDRAPTTPKPPQPPRTHPKPPPEVTPLSIEGRFGRIWLSDEGVLSNASADLTRDHYDWRTILVTGEVGDHAPASFDLAPLDGLHSRLSITSPDAGSVLKAMDIFDNVKGGALSLSGTLQDDDPARPVTGIAEIKDFQLVQAPVLARLVTVAGLTGILDLLSGQGIHFSALKMPFTYRDGILEIKDGRASGNAIGVTAKGRIDVDNDKLGLEGTVVPAYVLNSALGSLPVVGGIFSAEKGGGLFAINYQLRGSISDPDASFNPLSAFTPGFLRGLFTMFDNDDTVKKPSAPSGDHPNQ